MEKIIITQKVVRPHKVAHPRRHSVAQTAGDVISSSTVRPNERLSVLSQFSDGSQSESMEPRPEFCRNLRRARHQYDYAQKIASEKEAAEKEAKDAASASKK